MPTEPVLPGRADAPPGTGILPMALGTAGRGLGAVRRDLLSQVAAGGT